MPAKQLTESDEMYADDPEKRMVEAIENLVGAIEDVYQCAQRDLNGAAVCREANLEKVDILRLLDVCVVAGQIACEESSKRISQSYLESSLVTH